MSTDLVKQGATAVANPIETGSWNTTSVDPNDITIPKLTLMQAMSPQVEEHDDISSGDFIINSTNKVACKKGKTIEFIPLFCVKKWKIEKRPVGDTGMHKWVMNELFTPLNANAQVEWNQDGEEYRRVMVHEWVCLLADDIKRDLKARAAIAKGEIPDLDAALLPTVIPFKRSSRPASKELFKFEAKAQSFGLPVSVQTFKLGQEYVKDDSYSYYVSTVEPSRKSTQDEVNVCKQWFDILFSARADLNVDNSDEIPADMQETPRGVKNEVPHPAAQPEQAASIDDIPF